LRRRLHWAEARDRFRAGEPWWLDSRQLNAAATEEQDDRYQGDAWEDPIRQYLESEVHWSENGYGERKPYYVPRPEPLNDTSVAEVLEHALRIERGRWSQVGRPEPGRALPRQQGLQAAQGPSERRARVAVSA
jgi:hypothetical protein